MSKRQQQDGPSGDDLPSFIAYLRQGATDPTVVIGPLSWQPNDGSFAKNWYFIVATCGADGFRCDKVASRGDRATCEETRSTIGLLLTQSEPPCVIHVIEDELDAAKLCETLWNGSHGCAKP